MNKGWLDNLEARDQVFAIAVAAQRAVVYFALFPKKLFFHHLQKSVTRFQTCFGISFLPYGCRTHGKRIPYCTAAFKLFCLSIR